MREILFRGKRIDNGEWVEGFLVCDIEAWGRPDFHAYIVNHKHPSGCFGSDIYIEVDHSTVGQYTGLTDKNGKRIFEGDIVDILTENEEVGIVTYDDGGFLVEADGFSVDFHSNINGTDLEVIGTIHDKEKQNEGK